MGNRQNQLNALKARHAEIDEHLESAQRRPRPDETLIRQLKKRKLQLKDKIVALEADLHHPIVTVPQLSAEIIILGDLRPEPVSVFLGTPRLIVNG